MLRSMQARSKIAEAGWLHRGVGCFLNATLVGEPDQFLDDTKYRRFRVSWKDMGGQVIRKNLSCPRFEQFTAIHCK